MSFQISNQPDQTPSTKGPDPKLLAEHPADLFAQVEPYIEKNLWPQARGILLDALERSPRQSAAFRLLSWCFFQEEAYDKALVAISQAIELHSGQDSNYHQLGLILNALGQPTYASRAFGIVLQLNPDHPTARESQLATRTRAADYPLDQAQSAHLERLLRLAYPTISACLIVKNESANLSRCLTSLQGLVDEIIVVDTGSTDDTIAIAESFGAKIGHFAWCDDFAAARNASLDLATSDWVLIIDADEAIEIDDHEYWQKLLRNRELGAFVIQVRNLDANGNPEYDGQVLRIIQRLPGVKFSGRLHESVSASFSAHNLLAARTQHIRLLHTGYQQAAIESNNKRHRNIELAKLDVQDRPNSAEAWISLGRSQTYGGELEASIATYATLAATPSLLETAQLGVYASFIAGYRESLLHLGRWAEAEAVLSQGILRLPDETFFRFERGRLRARLGDLEGALDDFAACLSADPENYVFLNPPGITDELPRAALQQLAKHKPDWQERIEALLSVPRSPHGESEDWWARLEASPRDAEAFLGLAFEFFNQGIHDKALLSISQSIRFNANSAAAYHLLGLILDALGQASLAERAYLGALSLDPDHPKAMLCRQASRRLANPALIDRALEEEVNLLLKRQRPTVSACLIVKNEAENLPRCLGSLQGFVDEVVVVDTGSSDDTVAVAEAFGAKVGHFAWCNDFAAARNASLELATSDWVLIIDADEELQAPEAELWQAALRDRRCGAYLTRVDNETVEGIRSHHLVRLFLREPGVRFEKPLHESVTSSLKAHGLSVTPLAGVSLHHTGYKQDVVTSRNKFARNFQIAAAVAERNPDLPQAWHDLARSSLYLQDNAVTLQAFGRVAHLLKEGGTMAEASFCNYTLLYQECLLREGNTEGALALLERGLQRVPGFPDFLYERGLIRQKQGDLAGARADFNACIEAHGRFFLAIPREGMTDTHPRRALATLPTEAP